MAHLQTLRQVRDKFINRETPPSSTLVQVVALAIPGTLFEVDAVAVAPL